MTYHVENYYLKHEGGTKYWQVTSIVSTSGKGLLIRRWGKNGTTGQLKIEKGVASFVSSECSNLLNSKLKRGYDPGEADKGEFDTFPKAITFAMLDDFHKRIMTVATGYFGNPAVAAEEEVIPVNTIEPEPEPDRGPMWGSFS